MKRLIVNADDFGLTAGITDGILEAHLSGIVTRASIMPSARAFDYAVALARRTPSLAIGVHLTLVEESPVLDAACLPTLAPNGRLPASYLELLSGLLSGRIKTREIEREIHAQIDKCLSVGLRPTHLDSHQHVHAWPEILQLVTSIAMEYGIGEVRLPLDSPRGVDSKSALCCLARYGRRMLRNLSTSDQFAGLFESGHLSEAGLIRILKRTRDGTTELVCHPGHADADCENYYTHWDYDWDGEVAALTSPVVRANIEGLGIELVVSVS